MRRAVTDTNLRLHGAAPFRVAVIHGGPGAAGEMAPVARRLARDYGVLAPLQAARSVDGQIEELRDVLSKHSQAPVTLIGHSWGAWLSLLLAARYPELCAKLVLVSSPPFAESDAAEIRSRRLDRLNDAEKADYDAAVAALGDPATPDSDHLLARLGRLAAKADAYAPIEESDNTKVHISGEIYRAVWSEASRLRQSGELMRRVCTVKCPVVAIHGDADSSPAASVAEPLSAALKEFRMVVLRQCGHTPWLERYAKEEFYRALLTEIG